MNYIVIITLSKGENNVYNTQYVINISARKPRGLAPWMNGIKKYFELMFALVYN